MDATLTAIAGVAAALFGIGVLVVSILPAVLDMLQERRSKLQLTFTLRHIRWYFLSVAGATLVFAISTISALVGLVTSWEPSCPLSFGTCMAGIVLLCVACIGVFLELAPALNK
jgi:hypothetical protein